MFRHQRLEGREDPHEKGWDEIHGCLQNSTRDRRRFDSGFGGNRAFLVWQNIVPVLVKERNSRVNLRASHDITIQTRGDDRRRKGNVFHELLRLGRRVSLLHKGRETKGYDQGGTNGRGIRFHERFVRHGRTSVAVIVIDECVLGLIDPGPKQERNGGCRSDHRHTNGPVVGNISRHSKGSGNDLSRVGMEGRFDDAFCLPEFSGLSGR
mmetsp:Transcript_19548/g.48688  ORF Transcript_19548/g.48688 Transcript_19548/m.48688 type:complete len:209 (+) Transcript_19548:353-979(+)